MTADSPVTYGPPVTIDLTRLEQDLWDAGYSHAQIRLVLWCIIRAAGC